MTATTQTPTVSVADLRKQVRSTALKALGRSVGKSVLVALGTFALVIAAWLAVLTFFGISPYVAKGPVDVWNFLFVGEDAAEHRAQMAPLVTQTLVETLGMAAYVRAVPQFVLDRADTTASS